MRTRPFPQETGESLAEGKGKSVISIRGARTHNLKSVDVDIPRERFVVVTGLSGSGKSSLAFDTIHAEANRRYMESVSSYARHFMEALERPDTDSISNLSPSISIDQKSIARSPRSTVGTLTETYDYLRLLFAKAGTPCCPTCTAPLARRDARDIMEEILALPDGTRVIFLTAMEQLRRKTEKEALRTLSGLGYARVRFHNQVMLVSEVMPHASDMLLSEMDVVIDRLTLSAKHPDIERVLDSIETAFKLGRGTLSLLINETEERRYSREYLCASCGTGLFEVTPQTFSFNSPEGACPLCAGLGVQQTFDPELVVPNGKLTLLEGAIRPWSKSSFTSAGNDESEEEPGTPEAEAATPGKREASGNGFELLKQFAARKKIRLNVPVSKIKKSEFKEVLFGEPELERKKKNFFPGVLALLEKKHRETKSEHIRSLLEKFMISSPCPSCHGKRLRPEALAVFFDHKTVHDIASLSIDELETYFLSFLQKETNSESLSVVRPVYREIVERCSALRRVGLGYLELARSAETLSGGEAQRIKLATQMKSELSGVLYVLDEPSIGLHNRDTERLIDALCSLKGNGNSLVVVEHDPAVMKAADWIVDMGPGAGREGGEVLFSGTPAELLASNTETGAYLSGKRRVSEKRRVKTSSRFLSILGATEHNLKNIDVRIPLESFVVISGVSGSGKSTLITDILSRALLRHFYGARTAPGAHRSIKGLGFLDKAIVVNQDPIGRTPRSNAVTYTGAWTPIRDLFAATAEAEKAGFSASHFSFNMKGGRCEVCQGSGMKKIEMYLLPDRYVSCEVCGGTRYNDRTLAIEYRGMNVSRILDMTVSEARAFFFDQPPVEEKLRALDEVGLGYLVLGQSATNLSGGEAQRVKLAAELARKSTGKTLYILDEPTIGLHFEDVRRLLLVLDALVDKGNTVLVVEHNSDVISHADWVIDLGPEGGDMGGNLVFSGTPAELKKCKASLTGKYL
ncbi:MAG: excinuclease ABC subunit UvrA [Candidatus Moraniibacteriota bacterium]|nr:MAG: excinuclease ABC subunit UvrA [Candidatus Moranbacteria bacterium]